MKKNLLFSYLLSFVSIALPLAVFPYLTRTLSEDKFGVYLWIDAFTQYVLIFTTFGIPYYCIREIAKCKDDVRQVSYLTWQVIYFQCFLTILGSILFYIASLFFFKLSENKLLVYIGIGSLFFNCFLVEWYFQGKSEFKYITIRTLFVKIIFACAVFVGVKESDDTTKYAILVSLSVFINAGVNLVMFWKETGYFFLPDWAKIFSLFHSLRIFFLINVSISIYTLVDSILLGVLDSPEVVGLYSMPLKVVRVYWTVVNSTSLVFLPKVSSLLTAGDLRSVSSLLSDSLASVIALAAPFIIVVWQFPELLLNIAFGPTYSESAVVFCVLAFLPLIVGICNVFSTQFFVAFGKERYVLISTICGLTVSLVGNFILVPRYSIVGCGIATVAAEISVLTVLFFFSRKYLTLRVELSMLYSILSAGIFSSGLLYIGKIYVTNAVFLCVFLSVSYCLCFVVLSLWVFKSKMMLQLSEVITGHAKRYLNRSV